MKNSSAQKIVGAARLEQQGQPKWLEDSKKGWERSEITQKIFEPKHIYFYVVSLTDKPISLKNFKSFDPDIRTTKGLYTIQYLPLGSPGRNIKFPYLIGQDLVRLRVTVSGPKHWECVCQRIPELDWIRRNSTFSDKLFAIAKKHPGLTIRFGIDFVKYCEKIERAAEEQGIDIDHKPLVCYQWNDTVREQNKDKQVCPKKTKDDYAIALLEIERSPTVLREIKNKGE